MERLIRELRLSGPQFWKIALFVGSSLLVIAVFLFTNQAISRLTQEVQTTSLVLARFCAQASLPATRDTTLQRIFGEVIAGIDFPIVITDTTGLPRAWRDVGVADSLVAAASLDSIQIGLLIAPVIQQRVDHVREQVARLDRHNLPIEMIHPGSGVRLGAVHYGQPEVLERLRWMPLVSVGGVLLLLSLGLWGLAALRASEKRTIWVGMAKETAHQLGTPLSSLMGWIELLRAHVESAPPGEAVRIPAAELDETLGEMDRDVARLNKVAQRFSHVGSTPSLQLQDVTPVVREVVQYMRKRLPQGGGIVLRERYEEVPPVNLNRELMEWALENLIMNAISAIEQHPGVIEVAVERRKSTEAVEILIKDNGRGMNVVEQSHAFEPGYTTKPRGWGLGLALARRVVQDYHAGRLAIRASAPGEGTTMVISFPT